MVRKIILKVIVFIAVATGSAFVVDKINNIYVNKVSKELEQSTLPQVYGYLDNKIVNSMQGYTQVMSTSLMRDSVLPLNDTHGVEVLVDDRTSIANTYSYELRSVAGDNLIEEGTIEDIEVTSDGYRKLGINFRMDMEENQEYTLVIVLGQGEDESAKKIRYYTRVTNLSENYAAAMIDFAYDFHYTTFEKEYNEEEGNIVYNTIHPKAEAADNDLSHVSLDSSYNMISWGGMNIIAVTSLIPTVVELDKEFALVKFSYVVQNYSETNRHYYNVDEYYSMRYDKSSGATELLTFDRYQSSFFDKSYISRSNNSIGLGITNNSQIEYRYTEDNKHIAFVKEGELWLYDYQTAALTSVFSHVQQNYTTASSGNRSFDINIDKLDEDGNIYFTVYGYMGRGVHEGENGISLYYFSAEDSKIEEVIFVSCDEPFGVMSQEVGRFTYVDNDDNYYFLLDGSIFCMKLSDREPVRITDAITSGKYMVSQNRRIVAYPDSDNEDEVRNIYIRNYETGEEFVETAATNDRLLLLGFVGNDLIYGEAAALDIVKAANGKVTLPLKTIYIIEPNGEMIKQYDKPGIYIMNSVVQKDKIYLKRSMKMNSFFMETEPDFISYKSDVDDSKIISEYVYDDEELLRLELKLPSSMFLSDASLPIMTKHKESESPKRVEIDTDVTSGRYYVFGNKGYKAEFDTPGQAIEAVVGDNEGLVVDAYGNNIYRNQDAVSYNTVASAIDEHPCDSVETSFMTCMYMCMEYLDSRILYEDVMSYSDYELAFTDLTTAVGINISGIELSTALYFLDRDVPFAARIDDGRYVLVISYNSTHIRYYDPLLDEEVKLKRSEFEEELSKYGNTMYTFAK